MSALPLPFSFPEEREATRALRATAEITGAIEAWERRRQVVQKSLRFDLLSNGLKLSAKRSPELCCFLEESKEALGLKGRIDLYALGQRDSLAAAAKLDEDHFAIILGGQALGLFDTDELNFVIGHELAHIALDHFELLEISCDKLPTRLSEEVFRIRRMGEISADLTAATLIGASEPGRRALYKSIAGAGLQYLDLNHHQDHAQHQEITAMLEEDAALFEARSSHPASPVRLALLGDYEAVLRGPGGDTTPLREFQARALQLFNDSFPAAKEELGWLATVGAFWVAYADGDFDFEERKAVRELCRPTEFNELCKLANAQEDPRDFFENHFVKALEEQTLPLSKKAALLEKLVLVARADGCVHDEEVSVVMQIAELLGMDSALPTHLLRASA